MHKCLKKNHCVKFLRIDLLWPFFYLQWPSIPAEVKFKKCMLILSVIGAYIQKNNLLDVVVNVWPPMALMTLNWPLVTSNEILYQSHISYSSFALYVCIFTKISHRCVALLRVDLLWPYFDLQWPSIPAEVKFK